MNYVLKVSYGNDSIALIQWAIEQRLDGVYVLFSDTGWGCSWWPERVERGEAWARSVGFVPARTESMGMEALVKWRRGWPDHGGQFCTEHLKIRPYQTWIEQVDPNRELICCCGVRREESRKRMSWPEWLEESEADLGRSLWSPLASVRESERNDLIHRAGWEVLPHRSKECSPCIHANREDLRHLDEPDTAKVERIEGDLGFTQKGKPRLLFRPNNYMGATGIREVVKWANSAPGQYVEGQLEMFTEGCDSGFCSL